jgi:peroxiredoxin
MKSPRLTLLGSIVVVLTVAAALLTTAPGVRRAPDFTLYDLKGEAVTLRGKVTLVNFWATTCAVCVEEMPQIAQLHRALASQGLAVVAVSMPYDPPPRVAHFAQAAKLPFHVVMDVEGKIGHGFGGIEGTPTTFLVDGEGEVLLRVVGRPDFAGLTARVREALAHQNRS